MLQVGRRRVALLLSQSTVKAYRCVRYPPNPPGRGAENQFWHTIFLLFSFSFPASCVLRLVSSFSPYPIPAFLASCVLRLASFFPPFSPSPTLPFLLTLSPASSVLRLSNACRQQPYTFLNPPLAPPPPSLSSFGGQAGGDPLRYAFSHPSSVIRLPCVLRLASFLLPFSHSPHLPFRLSLRPASSTSA